eukprot:Platyproteum_vivax@DN15909_c0_g1_i1.p1
MKIKKNKPRKSAIGKGITLREPREEDKFQFHCQEGSASFTVVNEYFFEENNLRPHKNNKAAYEELAIKRFETVWKQFWSPTYTNQGQNKSWLLLAPAHKQHETLVVHNLIAVNNIPENTETEKPQLLEELKLDIQRRWTDSGVFDAPSVFATYMKGGDHFFGGTVTDEGLEKLVGGQQYSVSEKHISIEWTVG